MILFKNASFITGGEDCRVCKYLAIHKNKIAYIGDEIPAAFSAAKQIDLKGKTVVPAFSDTHIHFESYALFRSTVDVRDAKNFREMGNMIKQYLYLNPSTQFLPAYGCSAHTVEEKRLPDKNALDIITSRPLLIVKYDGHAAVANSSLIKVLPPEVTSDPGFDAETGWLYQNAFYKGVNFITQKIPPLKIIDGLNDTSEELAKKGIAYVHTVEGVGYARDVDVDLLRGASKKLHQKFKIFFQTMDVEKVTRRKMDCIGGCFSLALDGCFGSEDAALSEPYTNNENNKGFLAYSQEEVTEFCKKANAAGLRIALHAIGDAAVEQAINAFDAALEGKPSKKCTHVLIHGDLMPEHLQKKAAELGVTVAVQPAFLDWKQEPQEYLESILGDRAKQMLPLRSMIDNGLILTAGSDAPCTIPDPIYGIHLCCNHPNPEQSITALEALNMYTCWAARACGDDAERGTLMAGKAADFVVLDQNILDIPSNEIKNTKVLSTVIGGKVIK